MFFDQSSEPQFARDARFLAEAVPGDPAPASPEVLQACLVELGMVMHEVGFASHEIEGHAARVANVFGTDAEVFATPTALFLGVGPREDQRTLLLRLEPADDDLDAGDIVSPTVRTLEIPAGSSKNVVQRFRTPDSFAVSEKGIDHRYRHALLEATSGSGDRDVIPMRAPLIVNEDTSPSGMSPSLIDGVSL